MHRNHYSFYSFVIGLLTTFLLTTGHLALTCFAQDSPPPPRELAAFLFKTPAAKSFYQVDDTIPVCAWLSPPTNLLRTGFTDSAVVQLQLFQVSDVTGDLLINITSSEQSVTTSAEELAYCLYIPVLSEWLMNDHGATKVRFRASWLSADRSMENSVSSGVFYVVMKLVLPSV